MAPKKNEMMLLLVKHPPIQDIPVLNPYYQVRLGNLKSGTEL
jgi:hypothetical protein